MTKKIRWVTFWVLTFVCLVIILQFPLNKYEWMLEDPDLEMTRATLPIDHEASMYPFSAGVPALVLWVFYFFSKTRREKVIVLSVIEVLFIVWVIRFRSLLFGA